MESPGRAAAEIDAVLSLVNLTDVAGRRHGAIDGPARERIREADDAPETLSSKLVERASDEPGLAIERYAARGIAFIIPRGGLFRLTLRAWIGQSDDGAKLKRECGIIGAPRGTPTGAVGDAGHLL